VTSYSERLTVPWWAWPATFAAAAMLVAELATGALALRQPITFIAVGLVVTAGLLAVGRIRIRLDADPVDADPVVLRVDDANLPMTAIAAVTPIGPAERRDLLGVEADPLAFVIQRPWIGGGVRIDLADPDDPTPYWFVSSRHPDRLAAALETARVRAGAPAGPESPDQLD
jgi:hypothetical protein